ncbi:Hypothetical predicted protein [Paramuricea clavata]|uniref:Uncharacterized protein n=1 Tax=Paramuricea clavata TaxID=317549 RepID=A0A7D9EGB9_PARCT|nr:Hypothetical predicted protein [Paramuricea clavata]
MERAKRNLLSVSASIFDPLGLIAPITAIIKTIFQLLCKDKLNWNDIIPPDIALVWDKFLEELKGLQEIRQHRGKEKSWEPWVENRVVSIRNVVDHDRSRFVKGEVNPADVPTRISSNLHECFAGCWFSGPSFLLSQHFESGGKDISTDGTNRNSVDELSVKIGNISEGSCLNNTTQNDTPDNACSLNTVIDCTRYSSLKKLIVTTGYVMRFINNLRKQVKKQSDVITDNVLKVDEYETALSMRIKDEQLVIKRQSIFCNLRASLNLFDDKDGWLRLKG